MSIIYRITTPDGLKHYVGSTGKKYLCMRKSDHKFKWKQWKLQIGRKCTSYELFDEYGFDTCEFVEIEKVEKEQQLVRERHWIETYKGINRIRPTITIEEQKQFKSDWFQMYKTERKEEYVARNHTSYLKQKEKMSTVVQCECGKTYTANHKNRHLATVAHRTSVEPSGKKS